MRDVVGMPPSGVLDGRSLVRREKSEVDADKVIGFANHVITLIDDYTEAVRGRRPICDAFIAEIAGRFMDAARTSTNVVHAEISTRKATSASRRARTEVNVVLIEPGVASTYCVSRFHAMIDRVALTTCYDDARLEYVAHAAERLIERTETPDAGIRRLGRNIYDHAGLLALGSRLWAYTRPDEVGNHNVMLPVTGGVVMGFLVPTRAVGAGARGMKVARHFDREILSDIPQLGLMSRCVHLPVEQQFQLLFTGMTFIGDAEMSPRKARVRDLLRGIVERHPVVAIAGLAFTWPSVRRVSEALLENLRDLTLAYEELAALHHDPDVVRVFGRPRWKRVPPLPWEETPGDVEINYGIAAPRFRTHEQTRDLVAEAERVQVTGPR